jgi:hypothetical protein
MELDQGDIIVMDMLSNSAFVRTDTFWGVVVPRYVSRKYCNSADHLDNYGAENYEPKIQEGIEMHI